MSHPILYRIGRGRRLSLGLVLAVASIGRSAEPAEPFLRELPAGVFLQSSVELSAAEARTIGKKLGGEIRRLTNSVVQVHGRPIRVNAITAVDEDQAQAIHEALAKINPHPFSLRSKEVVFEFTGKDIDVALAAKTTYELGLVKKPDRLRYQVVAEVATIDHADYMAGNPLFLQFLALQTNPDGAAPRQKIDDLSRSFTFGHSLVLRNPKLGQPPATHQFQPPPTRLLESAATSTYTFDGLPERHGVPYVTLTFEMTVNATGLTAAAAEPGKSLTAATPFWPADDPGIVTLARNLTEGKRSSREKAMAILEWLTPGKNLKSSGPTGSRWGVARVLQQKFGHCWDYSDCFVTLARAVEVPSRQVAGWLYGTSGHVWAEYYDKGKGWQQVDATGGGQLPCGIYHIPWFTSESGEMPIVYLSMPRVDAVPADARNPPPR